MAPAPPLPYTPPYPVINAQPTFFAVIKNMGIGDYARFFFGGALGAAWGFAAGMCAFFLFCPCRQTPPPSPYGIWKKKETTFLTTRNTHADSRFSTHPLLSQASRSAALASGTWVLRLPPSARSRPSAHPTTA